MVRLWVANTDHDWFDYLASQPGIDEVNFWQPSGNANFGAIQPGELFLFRLKSPRNAIGGYGVFGHASNLPISLAWDAFGSRTAREAWKRCACASEDIGSTQRHRTKIIRSDAAS